MIQSASLGVAEMAAFRARLAHVAPRHVGTARREALLEAKEHTVDASDMTDEEIECVEQMAGMVDQWREMIGDDGSLRIYVD
jgi:hypothetical protein